MVSWDGLHQRTVHLHRKVQPRMLDASALVRVIMVVQQIHATTKRHRPVHHTELAMQATPAGGKPQAEWADGVVNAPRHSGLGPALRPWLGHLGRTHPVEHHPHLHTAFGRRGQRLGHRQAVAMKIKNIGFKQDFFPRLRHRHDQRRKQPATALQQLQAVISEQCSGHVHSKGCKGQRKSLIRGKWSEKRPQAGPCGAKLWACSRPRA